MAYGYLTKSTGWTAEIWFKRSAGTAIWPALFTQYTQGNAKWTSTLGLNGRQMWFGFSPTDDKLYLDIRKENGTSVVAWTDPGAGGYGSDGEWHHTAVRMSPNNINWYVFLDGEAIGTGTASAAIDWNPGILCVGNAYAPQIGQFGASGYLWDEALAMFAATNKSISQARIQEHYAAGSGGTVYYGDDEVERLTRIFDWTDTPITCRDTDDALSTLQGIEVAGANALDALCDTAQWANGYVFADGQSWIQYHNKRHRYNRVPLFTFKDSTASAIEAGVEFITDEQKIWNDIRGSRPYGGSYRMTDTVSIDEYGRRTYSFSLAITSAEELRNAVGWQLAHYGAEHLRVSGVMMCAETSSIIEAAASGRLEIGDHIVIDELPDWAPVSSLELTVEGIRLEADFGSQKWHIALNLTPAEFDAVFEVGTSVLGGTDKIAL